MKNASITWAAAVAGLCVLLGGLTSQAHETRNCKDYGLNPLGLFIDGQTVEEFLSNPPVGGLAGVLRGLETGLDDRALATLLQNINQNPRESYKVPTALQGIAGFTTTILLQRLLDEDGNPVVKDEKPIAKKILYGKIRDYMYFEENESGHLSVDVCTDDLMTSKRELYHWDIKILAKETRNPDGSTIQGEGFMVQDRVNDLKNPFPGLTMPAAALDPTNKRSVWYRGLDHKLGAKGKRIKIVNVYYRDLNDRQTPLRRFDDSLHYYVSTSDSCVDLFTPGHPPETVGQLLGKDYCLGRCTHPAIYNSGNGD